MSGRAKLCCLLGALTLIACGDDDTGSKDGATSGSPDASEAGSGGSGGAGTEGGSGGSAGSAGAEGGTGGSAGSGGRSGAGGRRSPLSCDRPSSEPVQCGGRTCPMTTEFENSPCFVPCCAMFDGEARCGFRGTAPGFTTECVLPAVADPSCDEIPQFQGCCEPTHHVCGIVGGFAPGCQTKSNFVTLPMSPKACGLGDADAGLGDDAGKSP